jgi:endonuclease G
MKKLILTILLGLNIVRFGFGQKINIDTIITNKAYTSFYSFKLKAPKLVIYKLYKGGGECKRNNFHFTTDGISRDKIATYADYKFSNVDRGHLVNAEDFAYDCELEELTFRYHNCFAQNPNLNRKSWKTDEKMIRDLSQTDSLIVFVGGFYDTKTIGNGVYVPITCYKMVYSMKKHEFIYSYIFTNEETPVKIKVIPESLMMKISKEYNVDIRYHLSY